MGPWELPNRGRIDGDWVSGGSVKGPAEGLEQGLGP